MIESQEMVPINPIKVHDTNHNRLMDLMEIAIQSESGIEKLQQIMKLQERWEENIAKNAFNSAMSKFQSAIPIIEKLGVVDYTSAKGRTYYHYAKIEDIAKSIQPALKENGLSYRFKQTQKEGLITVTCIVTHSLGHSDRTEISSTPDMSGGKDSLKSIASTISYLRRYTLTGILGIVVGGEDTDSDSSIMDQEIKTVNCYPDEEFNKNFASWRNIILGGKKSVETLHHYLTSKNIILSENQYNKLKQVGK